MRSTRDEQFERETDSAPTQQLVDYAMEFKKDSLFAESAADRELNAVDSEHSNNCIKDARRLYQTDKSLALPSHPFIRFGSGNLETLREAVPSSVNVRGESLALYGRWYSANLMKLAVVSKQHMGTLEQWARALFAAIRDADIAEPAYRAKGVRRQALSVAGEGGADQGATRATAKLAHAQLPPPHAATPHATYLALPRRREQGLRLVVAQTQRDSRLL